MFTWKETKNALSRMEAVGELPVFVCIAIDKENNFDGTALGHLGDFDEDDLPRVCYDMREFQFVEPEIEEDMKKKKIKKIQKKADDKNAKRAKEFGKYLDAKFEKRFYKQTDLGKKFIKNEWDRFYTRDFRVVSADDIIDTKAKDGINSEFKGMSALLITMGKGPKK